MAIVCENDLGWVIDHRQHIDQTYARVYSPLDVSSDEAESTRPCETQCDDLTPEGSAEPESFMAKPSLFEIHHPFMMDSEFHKAYKVDSESSSLDPNEVQVKKKRKRKAALNPGQEAALEFHQQVREVLKRAAEQLVRLARNRVHFLNNHRNVTDNNKSARQAAIIQGPGNTLTELCDLARHNQCGDTGVHQLTGQGNSEPPCLFNTLVTHKCDTCTMRHLMGARYLIPPHCRFLMSDITHMEPLMADGTKYDVIVMDPPWENKSVKRKKKYASLNDWSLQELPIPALAAPGCLLVVWVTNKQRQHSFVRNTLFPRWSATFLGMWYWLKVTTSGELVRPLDDSQKKPYECLILGRVKPRTDAESIVEESEDLSLTENKMNLSARDAKIPGRTREGDGVPAVCGDQVIVSVPCSIHSRKPPLNEILKSYLPAQSKCLELFARNLLPGWTSWGNEVLKFQHIDFYEKC